MPKVGKIKVTQEKLSQTINLKEVFGQSFSGQKALKEAIAQALIDKIVERTESGIAVTGKKLKAPYSKAYTKTLEFKAAGKRKNKVNMTLTGDMLRSIDVIGDSANTITIGIDEEDEAAKAFNHQVGDTVPKRPFFGLTNKDVDAVKKEFKADLDKAFKKRGDSRGNAVEAILLKLLRSTDGEG